MHTIFALCYRPGPAWLPDTPVLQQPLKEHRAYMSSLMDAGTVVLGGPYSDDTGGLVAVEAHSREAAAEIGAGDPAVRDGIMLVDVHPWLIMGGSASRTGRAF